MSNNKVEKLGTCGLIPVAVIDNPENAVALAKAMLSGGIDCIEVTMRTASALESISMIVAECPEMTVGAGTVTSLEAEKKCLDNGASFIVSPGFDEEMAKYSISNDIAFVPGCATPTEIMAATGYGIDILKFFPANVYGGLSAMKALSGPFGHVRFIPTGGVNADNLKEYISADFVYAVGGSWVCTKDDVNAMNFEKIAKLCNDARTAIDEIRK